MNYPDLNREILLTSLMLSLTLVTTVSSQSTLTWNSEFFDRRENKMDRGEFSYESDGLRLTPPKESHLIKDNGLVMTAQGWLTSSSEIASNKPQISSATVNLPETDLSGTNVSNNLTETAQMARKTQIDNDLFPFIGLIFASLLILMPIKSY